MKFGIRYANTGPYTNPDAARDLVRQAEDAGFESVWTVEHVLIPPNYESQYPYTKDGRIPEATAQTYIPDPMVWMAYCAAVTERIRFGSAVIVLPMRNPVLFAKESVTLDNLSNGRLMLGLGSGWLEEEFRALGCPFADRGKRMDDSIDILRYLWGAADDPKIEGFELHDINMEPKPKNGSIPIHIGGDSKVAARRAGRLGDGYFPARGYSSELRDTVWRAAEKAGRDPEQIEITVSMPNSEAELEALASLGVDRVAVPVTSEAGLKQQIDGAHDLPKWQRIIERYQDL